MTHKKVLILTVSMFALALIAGGLFAQRGPGRGRGPGQGQGKGGPGFRGGRQDPTFETDHEVFQFLLANGGKIQRDVKNLKNGIETLTESNDPQITVKIQEHVAAMYDRLKEVRPIHMRDPLFRELFQHTNKIDMKSELTEKGIRVVETSDDPYVAKLLQEHAKVVSLFIKNGFAEAHKNHAVPVRQGKPGAVAKKVEAATATGCCKKEACCQGGKCQAGAAGAKAEPGPATLGEKACCQGEKQSPKKGAACQGGKCKTPVKTISDESPM